MTTTANHTEARLWYAQYQARVAELKPHQNYAQQVAAATVGRGKTPVQPLATMGTGGGPLLCDHCGKPLPLEDHPFRGVSADKAWAKNPVPGWQSYILGGVVISTESNGTVRVYHGHPGDGCCAKATAERDRAYDQFTMSVPAGVFKRLGAFLADEFPHQTNAERLAMMNAVVDVLWGHDPGIGVNRPE
jgi:hypothetical protein